MGSLDEEEVEEDLAADVEDEADVDGGAAAPFSREVPGVDQETGGKDEGQRAGVDGQDQDSDRVELFEVADFEGFQTRGWKED